MKVLLPTPGGPEMPTRKVCLSGSAVRREEDDGGVFDLWTSLRRVTGHV